MILPEKNAFSQILDPPLGDRSAKPRRTGVTMVIDKGLGKNALADLMETAGAYVDVLKLGFGTSTLYPVNVLKQKIQLTKLFGVVACTGGTLAEIAIQKGRFESMVNHALELGFGAVEVSDGTLTMDQTTRQTSIQTVIQSGLMAITEVGKKLDAFPTVSAIVHQVDRDLAEGAEFVILEGRESGENIGIYRDGGAVDEVLLNQLVQQFSTETLSRLMWEAPKKAQQISMLKRFGREVNLGNIAPDEVFALESLRLGLRSDTFVWSFPSHP